MKIALEGKYTKDLRDTIRGYNMRVGVFTAKKHKPAASKNAGHKTVFGYKARKTTDEIRRQVQDERKKLRAKIAKIRADAREQRAIARSTQSRTVAKRLRAKAKRRMQKAKALSESQPKPVKARKATMRIRDVFVSMQKKAGIDLLRRPFRSQKTRREVKAFTSAFLRTARKGRSMGKVEALLLDVVRIPILKRRYGKNSPATIAQKGFNRRFFDTSQVVDSLEAKIKKRATRKKKA